jgi:hypothetical protein
MESCQLHSRETASVLPRGWSAECSIVRLTFCEWFVFHLYFALCFRPFLRDCIVVVLQDTSAMHRGKKRPSKRSSRVTVVASRMDGQGGWTGTIARQGGSREHAVGDATQRLQYGGRCCLSSVSLGVGFAHPDAGFLRNGRWMDKTNALSGDVISHFSTIPLCFLCWVA